MVLDEQFIQKCREAFNTFDQDGSGTIDTQEMKLLLEAIGEAPSEEELFRFMADVDEDGTGEIEFAEFLRAFEKQRGGAQELEDELDTIDAFVALGGEPDKPAKPNFLPGQGCSFLLSFASALEEGSGRGDTMHA